MCVRCCARALVHWWHTEWDLDRWMCGHHSDDEAQDMVSSGWAVLDDERGESVRYPRVPRPPLPALSADPATH